MATIIEPTDKTPETDNPGQDEFNKLIDKNISPGDERMMEERAKDGAIDDNVATNNGAEQNEQQQVAQHNNQSGSFYKKSEPASKGFLQTWRKRRKLLAGLGLLASLTAAIALLFFAGLNVLKLDDLMSNIDAKTFARFNSVASSRSDAWMQAYLEIRLMDIGDNPDLNKGAESDNLIFQANKLNTGNPALDWYKTLRTSSFEEDMLNKSGIKFVSVLEPNGTGGYKVRPGKIDFGNGNSVPIDISKDNIDIAKIASGDTATLNKYKDLVSTFNSNKEARAAIKEAVQQNTDFFQVLKRRNIRKNIQNLTGVTDWTFFEQTQAAYNQKKIDIRNKIVTKAIPESTLAGKFVRCLFGITSCKFSDDPENPEYKANTALADEGNPDNQGDKLTDSKGNTVQPLNLSDAAAITKQILAKANITLNALNIVNLLDSLSKLSDALKNHDLSKGVAIARGVQAMGLYQTFETSRDQIKTGQLSGAELNKLMEVLGPIASSEGWTKVISGQGDPTKLTNNAASQKYCDPKNQAAIENNPTLGNQQFAYLCPDKQIGGTSTAATLESAYNNSIGSVVGPILSTFNSARNAPVIGPVTDFLTNIVNAVSGVVSGLFTDLLKAVGLGSDIKSAMTWIVGQVAAFLGAGPIINGNESAGVLVNWLVQGGSFTAEASARANGAAATTPTVRAEAESTLAQYESSQNAQMSTFDKYLSFSNPDSAASRSAFALSQLNMSSLVSKLTDFSSLFKTIGAAIMLPFNGNAHAQAADTGYSGANFAGIKTFDFPQQCLDRNPVDPSYTPTDGTNAFTVFQKYGLTPSQDDTTKLQSWDTENSSDDFYATIYDVIGNRDDSDTIAEQIYDCNLIDTTVRGGIGYVYGYTNDNGLNDSSSTTPTNPSSGGISGNGSGQFTTNTSQAAYPGLDQMLARVQAASQPAGEAAFCASIGGCSGKCESAIEVAWLGHRGVYADPFGSAGNTPAAGSAWAAALASGHAHPGDRNPPVGALLIYNHHDPSDPWGHITIYLGNNLVFSTDFDYQGGVGIQPASHIETGSWANSYVGWMDPYFNGVVGSP